MSPEQKFDKIRKISCFGGGEKEKWTVLCEPRSILSVIVWNTDSALMLSS